MAKATGEGLPAVLAVDCNHVIVKIAPNNRDSHRVVLATPQHNWVQQLCITGGAALSRTIYAGNEAGRHCKDPNSHIKYDALDLETKGHTSTAVQFKKPKTFGVVCDYGTRSFEIPDSKDIGGCVDVVFLWPDDAAGEGFNHFKAIINEVKGVTGVFKGIAEDCVALGEAGAKLAACFA